MPGCCLALAACDLSPLRSQGGGQSASHFDAQTAEYDRQLKAAGEQTEANERAMKRQLALLERSEKQGDRMDALIVKWEEQAKRCDAILSRWEQQAAPPAPPKEQ